MRVCIYAQLYKDMDFTGCNVHKVDDHYGEREECLGPKSREMITLIIPAVPNEMYETASPTALLLPQQPAWLHDSARGVSMTLGEG